MKSLPIIAAAVGLLLVGLGAGWWWRDNSSISTRTRSAPDTAQSDAAAQRAPLYWRDPMVPGQRFDKPGKSPYMDMQLVPVYADERAQNGAVKVASNVSQSLGIRLGKVTKAVVQPQISAIGSVAFDERLLQMVQARVSGFVTRLHVKVPLDHVHRGQSLADITAPEWQQAAEEYAALLGDDSEYAKTIRTAARGKLMALGVPESAIVDLEHSGKATPTVTIYAPLDGVISELGVREGSAFAVGATLFRINGLRSVWVNAQVPEAQRYLIPANSVVTARATGWPEDSFTGRLDAVLPAIDAATRTITLRAVLDNASGKLSPGMFVSLDLAGAAGVAQLMVPSEAVITTGQRKVVILARSDAAFDVVDVATGVETDGNTAILSGLQEGQSIVLSGQFLIDSEASLTATVNRLAKP
jgi:membrane fusion protein, copper/silver efflux system